MHANSHRLKCRPWLPATTLALAMLALPGCETMPGNLSELPVIGAACAAYLAQCGAGRAEPARAGSAWSMRPTCNAI